MVTVSNEFLSLWRASVNDFRDPHLLTLTAPVDEIEVHGTDTFTVLHQSNDTWRIVPQGFAADAQLVKDLLTSLSGMQVTQFVKDVVIEPDLGPKYGLAAPARKYVLKTAAGGTSTASNGVIAELHFGTNQDDRIYARRSDESSVYAVNRAEVERLPAASWQLRERRIWNRNEDEVVSVTVRQNGKMRKILHKGEHNWSLAPGSQGNIEDLAVDQTVRDLCALTARMWVARGAQRRGDYHFAKDGPQITLQLKNGDELAVELGGQSPAGFPCAAVCLDEELWIFEFSPSLNRDMVGCLTIPEHAP